jgi:predicted methyltransferase
MRKLTLLFTTLATSVLALTASAAPAPDAALAAAIASPTRTAKFVERDKVRHPAEELTFFGLRADQNVVEVWPGGGYWTEILAPYLKTHGHLTVAVPTMGDPEEDATTKRWRERLAQSRDVWGPVTATSLGNGHYDIAPAGSADLIVTFRNLHNWMGGGYAEAAVAACFRALKPGGILGIEEHRGRADQPQDPKAESGYVREDYAIALAKAAGFELVERSEINANPRDTKDWAKGVWTLPPTLALGDQDRAKYVAIGEADNFVLKFRKPAATH